MKILNKSGGLNYIRSSLAIILISILTIPAAGQNLVPNPSFEDHSLGCPTQLDQIHYADYWIKPSLESPDYYNACATGTLVDVPQNKTGYQYPRNGDGYAGVGVYHYKTAVNEFIETPLSTPLIAGQKYFVSFYVSLADSSNYEIDAIGAHFSTGSLYPSSILTMLLLPEHISNPTGRIISDKDGWTQICGTYIASGGEDHLTLGNFKHASECNFIRLGPGEVGAYFYIDDVEVRPVNTGNCEFMKPGYLDFCPNGMPDFDMKQENWKSSTGRWSWDGPVALANCLWWFDSQREPYPIDPRPFYYPPNEPGINDNYSLVESYEPYEWDDHDRNNVVPFIEDLKTYCRTDAVGQLGTILWDLGTGADDYIVSRTDLPDVYTVNVILGPEYDLIKDSVKACKNVILLFGFYEEIPAEDSCRWLGGHYVTAAGVCNSATDICISDPYIDANEGEPPPGASGHSSAEHNDAYNISGPHGLNEHDWYHLESRAANRCTSPANWQVTGYPNDYATFVSEFAGQNAIDPVGSPGIPYYGNGDIAVLLDAAVIIGSGSCYCTGDVNNDGSSLSVEDLDSLIAYVTDGMPVPSHLWQCDLNGDNYIDWLDVELFQNYFAYGIGVFENGYPVPVSCCPVTTQYACCINSTCTHLAAPNCIDQGGTVVGFNIRCYPDPCGSCCINFTGNTNCSEAEEPDISDIVRLIDNLYLSKDPLCCPEEADVNGSGGEPDISDIVRLIDYLYLATHTLPAFCPY